MTAMTGGGAWPSTPLQLAKELESVHPRHPEIAQDQIDVVAPPLCSSASMPSAGRHDICAESFERHAHRFERVLGVFDDEDAEAVERQDRSPCGDRSGSAVLRCRGGKRQAQCHLRAAADPVAGHAHGSSVRLRQLLDEREADAESRIRAPRALLLLLEHLEHERQELRRDAFSRVAHPHDALDRPSRASSVIVTAPPAGVNFTAFSSTFLKTCCRRSPSPLMHKGSGASMNCRVMSFL